MDSPDATLTVLKGLVEEVKGEKRAVRNAKVKQRRKVQKMESGPEALKKVQLLVCEIEDKEIQHRQFDSDSLGSSSQDPGTPHITGTSHSLTEHETIQENLLKEIRSIIPVVSRPTYIQSSREEWDTIRQDIKARFADGMFVRDLAIGKRQSALYTLCPDCEVPLITDRLWRAVNVISISGMKVKNLNINYCPSCSWKIVRERHHFVSLGLWPCDAEGSAFFDFRYMLMMSYLQHMSPELSLSSIVQALQLVTSLGNQHAFVIKQDAFNYAMNEWRTQELAYLTDISMGLFQCPSCQDTPHTVHLDGNAKLYRYNKGSSLDISCSSDFFLSGETVTTEVEKIMPASKHVELSKNCGESRWKAAAKSSSKNSNKDVTGCMLATCRHSVLLKGLDMLQGEMFAYPYVLQKQFPAAEHIAMDVMCKYFPWLQRVDPHVSQLQVPFLSVMHAKAHNWKCQVTWSGRCVDGVGLSTGETTEQANSYLSRLGRVTRHMTPNSLEGNYLQTQIQLAA